MLSKLSWKEMSRRVRFLEIRRNALAKSYSDPVSTYKDSFREVRVVEVARRSLEAVSRRDRRHLANGEKERRSFRWD